MNERLKHGRKVLHAALLVTVLSTAACGKREATGQTVAIVNGDDITLSDLNLELGALPPRAREGARAQVLQALVSRKLLAQDAIKQGVDRSPDFVLQQRRTRELTLAQRAFQGAGEKVTQPVTDGDITSYLNSHPDIGAGRRILLVDQLQFATPKAQAKLAALKPAKTLDEVAAILKSEGIAVSRARAQLDTAVLETSVLTKIAALQPGEPIIAVNGANSVANAIIESRPAPLAGADARAIAKKKIQGERLQDKLQQYEQALRNGAKVVYSQGYAP